ncbi:MAG: glycosyltransferase family 1 protein [Candidatus Wallbacteria bacterium]
MKILYDHQIFEFQIFGGISRYFDDLISFFSNCTDITPILSLKYTNNHYIKINNASYRTKKLTNFDNFICSKNFKGKWFLYNFFKNTNLIKDHYSENQKNTIKLIEKADFDIFHPTYFNDYFLSHLNKKPFVITIYDMIYELYPEYFADNKKVIEQKKKLIEKASAVIAISENTRQDILKIYGKNYENKVKVVYLSHSSNFLNYKELNHKLPDKYILFVGVRNNYKNFINFIKAMSEIIKIDKELKIICTGGGKFTKDELALFNELNLSSSIFQYSVNDNILYHFYNKATAFVFPSLYEGFGIPVLEAFAAGCPAILSNSSSLPEVGGDAAEYFDPASVSSIKESIKKVIYNDTIKNKLKNDGFERLKQFTLTQTALGTKKIYESIIKS